MSARSFFDTNVLLYTDSSDAPTKRKRALELLAEHRLARTDLQHGRTIDGVRIMNPFR